MHHFALIYRFVGFTRCNVLLILLVSIAALLLAIFGGSEVGAVAPGFAAKQDFGTGAGPFYLAVADFNNDGKADVAVTNSGSASVSVLVNTTTPGATSFSFAPKQDFFPGANPWGVAAADFNGDGMMDLAVASSSNNNVAVFLNTTIPGSATLNFASPQPFATGTTPRGVKAGDFNLDGMPDLAVVNSASGVNTVSVLLNTTTPGALTPGFAAKQDFATGANPVNVSLGDLNGDGKLDIAVNNSSDHTVSVFINFTPAGTLTAMFFPKQDFASGNGPSSIAMGDLNRDGKLDIVTDRVTRAPRQCSLILPAQAPTPPALWPHKTLLCPRFIQLWLLT